MINPEDCELFTCNTATSHSTSPIFTISLSYFILLTARRERVVRVVDGGGHHQVGFRCRVETDLASAGLRLGLATTHLYTIYNIKSKISSVPHQRQELLLGPLSPPPLSRLTLLPAPVKFVKTDYCPNFLKICLCDLDKPKSLDTGPGLGPSSSSSLVSDVNGFVELIVSTVNGLAELIPFELS